MCIVVSAQALRLVRSTSIHEMPHQMGAVGYALFWNNLNILELGRPHEIFSYFIQRRLYKLMEKVRYIFHLTPWVHSWVSYADADEEHDAEARVVEDFNEKAPPVRQPPPSGPKI